ncbi:hypothetical protein KO493_08905 [Tamlana agarivorans]|uniref:Uncharacterized protein n=1 Tax=Pseudotamlana agarivorans TaxID=481183 RepID=A0ACC5U923_9FLAO|nr:hypothetical protein [Tamlana agarivorans]MBU2950814.1 hypothetical protein [Tamlana agarivorans]
MKNNKFKKSLIVFLLVSSCVFSQDIIITKNKDSILSEVKEIRLDEISFHKANNLDGPLYVLSKSEIFEIIFKNGTSEKYAIGHIQSTLTKEQTKDFLKENIDKYCYDRSGKFQIIIEFEGDYMRFYRRAKNTDDVPRKRELYNFSKLCIFHKLSKRNQGISYINAEIPRFMDNSKGGAWKNSFKLVLRVNSHENGGKILDAMKHYHSLLTQN